MSGISYLNRPSNSSRTAADLLISSDTVSLGTVNNTFGAFRDVDVDLLDEFPGHPFKVEHNKDMDDLMSSIHDHGVHTPICVMTNPENRNRYIIIYGHKRTFACKELGIRTIPATVRNIDLDLARIIMSENNLLTRTNISPMERGKSYREELIGMKELVKKGRRGLIGDDNESYANVDNLLSRLAEPGRTPRDLLAEKYGVSHEDIRRLIRLTALIEPLQDLVDSGKLKVRPGVDLSYLAPEKQKSVYTEIQETGKMPSAKQAARLRKEIEGGATDCTLQTIREAEEIEKSKRENEKQLKCAALSITFPKEAVARYFPKGFDNAESIIMEALEAYSSRGRNTEANIQKDLSPKVTRVHSR